jgi:hypothetical protein
LQPSLFTRLASAEAELRALKEILPEVLDILAEVNVNQDKIRQEHDERCERVERLLTDQRRWWWQRLGEGNSVLRPARLSMQAKLMLIRALLKDHDLFSLNQLSKNELTFWKDMGRTAITVLFLMAVLMIGLHELLNQNSNY